MEDFEKKLSIKDSTTVSAMEVGSCSSACDSFSSTTIVHLLRKFLNIQQRRAQAYSKLKRSCLLFYFLFLRYWIRICLNLSSIFLSWVQGIFRVYDFGRGIGLSTALQWDYSGVQWLLKTSWYPNLNSKFSNFMFFFFNIKTYLVVFYFWVQVLEMESLFLNPDYCRVDLAKLLRSVQEQEKQKLHLVTNVSISLLLFIVFFSLSFSMSWNFI